MRSRKGWSLIAAIFLVIAVIFGPYLWVKVKEAKADTLETHHSSWSLVRETATEDGATFAAVYDLAGAEGDFASKDSSTMVSGGPFHITAVGKNRDAPEGYSPGAAWVFAIAAGAFNDDTFSFTMVGWAKINGPAQVICEGDGIVGTQDVVLYPDDGAAATDPNIFWADTINIDTSTDWPGNIGVFNSGNNRLCFIAMDLTGLEWIQFVFYDAASGQAGEADPITVFGRRY